MRDTLDTPLRVLMLLVGLVLLITCANVSNLMVAKATSRKKEIAMRLALGAGRRRIVRQLLVESTILAFVGGALSLVLAYWLTGALLTPAPTAQARLALSRSPDARVLGFSLAVSALAALAFGLLPALQAARTDLVSYEATLGCSVVSRQENGIDLGLGDSFLGLYDIPGEVGRIHHFASAWTGTRSMKRRTNSAQRGSSPT